MKRDILVPFEWIPWNWQTTITERLMIEVDAMSVPQVTKCELALNTLEIQPIFRDATGIKRHHFDRFCRPLDSKCKNDIDRHRHSFMWSLDPLIGGVEDALNRSLAAHMERLGASCASGRFALAHPPFTPVAYSSPVTARHQLWDRSRRR